MLAITFSFAEEAVKKNIVKKVVNVLAFPEGAVKKVLASLEKCWQFQKELLKNVGKLSNVLEFAEEAFEKCWQA